MEKKNRVPFKWKVFLGAAGAFALTGILIAVIVMAILPPDYRLVVTGDFDQQTDQIVQELENSDFAEAGTRLQEFCMTNEATATLFGGSNYMHFEGGQAERLKEEEKIPLQRACSLTIKGEPYDLYLTKYADQADGKWGTVGRILPVFAKILGVISVLAGGCIAVLSQHLAETTEKLKQTLGELKEANLLLEEDIKKERERESFNRDFFAAVSHELKTPLTVLKGELEGMIYQVGVFRDRERYLRHAWEITGQMEGLIREILEVSRLQLKEAAAQEAVDIGNILAECNKTFQGLMAQKDLECQISDTYQKVMVQGEEKLWKKAISNIVGNAVLHSPKGEKVQIRLEKNVLTVENTGIWIDQEQREKLFQPFYRGDFSRSRDTGGSGLGLYLVKQILELYNCRYEITNTKAGVRFTIDFSRALFQNNTGASPELYPTVVK